MPEMAGDGDYVFTPVTPVGLTPTEYKIQMGPFGSKVLYTQSYRPAGPHNETQQHRTLTNKIHNSNI